MSKKFLEIGKIVNTHGIRGEVKVQPWCDSPEFLADFDTLYWSDYTPIKILNAKIHKGCVLLSLEGVTTMEQATALRNKILYMDRDDAELDENAVFIQDLIGLTVFDQRLNHNIGKVKEVLTNASSDIYVVSDGTNEYLIPAVHEFLRSVDVEAGIITICSIEGLLSDED